MSPNKYPLNQSFKDPETGDVFWYQESSGYIWKIFADGRPSINLGLAVTLRRSAPTTQENAANPARSASQTGDTTGLAKGVDRLGLSGPPHQLTSKDKAAAKSVSLRETEVREGIKDVTAHDRETGAETDYRIGPTRTVGTRRVVQKTIRGSRGAGGGVGNADTDNSSPPGRGKKAMSRVRPGYKFGQVIETTLVPLPEDNFSDITAATARQEPYPLAGARAAPRRFVVVEPATDRHPYFVALPIKTYNGQGVASTDANGAQVIKAYHVPIYTVPLRPPAPYPTQAEQVLRRLPNGMVEMPMQSPGILVIDHDRACPLDPVSRLDYSDPWSFSTNANVQYYGHVDSEHETALRWTYGAVRDDQLSTHGPPTVSAAMPVPQRQWPPGYAETPASYAGTPPSTSPASRTYLQGQPFSRQDQPNTSSSQRVKPQNQRGGLPAPPQGTRAPAAGEQARTPMQPAPGQTGAGTSTFGQKTASQDLRTAAPRKTAPPQGQQPPPTNQKANQATQPWLTTAQTQEASQAQNARRFMQQEMQRGRSQAEAFDLLVQRYVDGGYTRDAAIAKLRCLMPEYAQIRR